jgi:Family of unknown function (DUF5681)
MNNQPEENSERDPDGHWRQGHSGNPRGRPKGARHRVTILAEQLMQGDAEDVVRAVIAAAKGGDMTAARIILDRIAPVRKGSTVMFDLPELTTPTDLPPAVAAVTKAIADGTLTPDEGASVVTILDMQRRAIETADLARRVADLEKANERQP